MNFTSFEFVLFFALVVGVRRCLRNFSAEKWFLLVASLAFYLSWSVPCVVFILFTSLADFFITQKMGRTPHPGSRRRLLVISLVFNLGLLGFFKYANFFLENLSATLNVLGWHVGPLHYNIILPPAISYYTFASLSYVLDVYYERMPVCRSARDYTLFITFFPKLLSGPIVRARELLPQFQDRVRATTEDIEVGLAYFMIGAVKKLVIADQIAPHVNLIFSAPGQYDGLTLLTGVMGYAVQLYCDFSGYSDMAIGCARVLGFRFPDNFKMPYSSRSITEFWRRWHITLSFWFRDYLFMPLEIATRSNPRPLLRASINMMATMLLVGLWHGPSWNYVIFGGIHGAALVIHNVWTKRKPQGSPKPGPGNQFLQNMCSHFLTLGVILLAFVFFRAQSVADAFSCLGRMVSWSHGGTRLISPYILAAIAVVFLVHLFVKKDRNLAEELPQRSPVLRTLGYASLLLLLVVLGATEASPFIYFQF
jgi:alginate O-acetyltransferase complex protein AlgI